MKIAVFVSGNGSNLQALLDAQKRGELSSGEIALVVSNKKEAFALERAKKEGVKTFILEASPGETREEYDKKVSEKLHEEKIELVVLAGFMQILSEPFVKEFEGHILNIHPSLLPAFKGVHGIKDAFESGEKVTGVTVHFVENELDAGPIVLQVKVPITDGDTPKTLEDKIHKEEHKIYPKVVRLFVEGKIKLKEREVTILQ